MPSSRMWVKPKMVCSLEWIATIPPTKILTIYPLRSQSTPNHTNSLLIPVGMYIYFITYLPVLITSPTTILNYHINSFYSLDTALVSISCNFLSIFPYPLHSLLPATFPGGSYLKLSCGAISTVCSQFIPFWLTKISGLSKHQLSFRVLFYWRDNIY